MRKSIKKLQLNRETVKHLAMDDAALRGAAGGIVTLRTCGHPCSADCSTPCSDYSCGSCPPQCSARIICGQ